ncbi:hypothetical protein KSF78_0009319 [Schistosoma japonicum]|nr:hypothetical protein KSF78_0009319 [Schistosoma japonicum]
MTQHITYAVEFANYYFSVVGIDEQLITNRWSTWSGFTIIYEFVTHYKLI